MTCSLLVLFCAALKPGSHFFLRLLHFLNNTLVKVWTKLARTGPKPDLRESGGAAVCCLCVSQPGLVYFSVSWLSLIKFCPSYTCLPAVAFNTHSTSNCLLMDFCFVYFSYLFALITSTWTFIKHSLNHVPFSLQSAFSYISSMKLFQYNIRVKHHVWWPAPMQCVYDIWA